jgi:hypothetical protein
MRRGSEVGAGSTTEVPAGVKAGPKDESPRASRAAACNAQLTIAARGMDGRREEEWNPHKR